MCTGAVSRCRVMQVGTQRGGGRELEEERGAGGRAPRGPRAGEEAGQGREGALSGWKGSENRVQRPAHLGTYLGDGKAAGRAQPAARR